ncbi:MAG: GAF domain-containing protein [Anaerolineae bacterium]
MSEKRRVSQDISRQDVVGSIRRRLIDRALLVAVISGPFAVIAGAYSAYQRENWLLFLGYLIAYAVPLSLFLWKGSPYPLRAGGISLLAYVLGLVDLLAFGWGADGRIFLLAFAVLVALFFGRRGGFFALGIGFVTLLAVLGIVELGWVSTRSVLYRSLLFTPDPLANCIIFLWVGALVVISEDYFTSLLFKQLEGTLILSEELAERQAELDQRTEVLQSANYAMQRRAMHLEASAEVARAIASIFELQQLLSRVVSLISHYFGFYHTGIFLLDVEEDTAVLEAASSEGGRRMLAKGHRLARGEGMVGWVLEHGEPRVALDVGEDAVHFANPLLSATRSEVALPLKLADEVIGVLDVQSTEEGAFDADDVRALELLAGQVAVALENARRFDEEGALLEATSSFYRMARRVATARTAEDIYRVMLGLARDYAAPQAFVYSRADGPETVQLVAELRGESVHAGRRSEERSWLMSLDLLSRAFELEEFLFIEDLNALGGSLPEGWGKALRKLRADSSARSVGFIPIRVGGQVTSLLVIFYNTFYPFPTSERQLYRLSSDLAGVALENMRLVQAVQLRADRERMTREISTTIRASTTTDGILQTTVRELGRSLGATGWIQFGGPDDGTG